MVTEDGKEEKSHGKDLDESQESPISTKKKDKNPMLICKNDFHKLNDDVALSYSAFDINHFSESKNENLVAWKINGDAEKFNT